jgi:hypothetical protein
MLSGWVGLANCQVSCVVVGGTHSYREVGVISRSVSEGTQRRIPSPIRNIRDSVWRINKKSRYLKP